MPNASQMPTDETIVRIFARLHMSYDKVVYYDPQGTSEFSSHIETHLHETKEWFGRRKYEFVYIPDLCSSITEQQIRYLIPNWKGEPIQRIGNDWLKERLDEDSEGIGAGFLRLENARQHTYRFFPLAPLMRQSFDEQLKHYATLLRKRRTSSDDSICSITEPADGDGLYSVYEKKLSLADEKFSEESINREVKKLVKQLHKEGFEEFVLRCMVPIDDKLSRIVITPNYGIVLPDYGDTHIEMKPLPKSIFLLFLRHKEGIYFKDLVDYRDELRELYVKITNRTNPDTINKSIAKVVDPTENAINENCSRIREAFLKHIDEHLARKYYITGHKAGVKRITLPRELVEWQGEK